LLLGMSVVGWLWPLLLVVPLGIAGVWVALALMLDAYKLWRQNDESSPSSAEEGSETDGEGAAQQIPTPQPTPIPGQRGSQIRTRP